MRTSAEASPDSANNANLQPSQPARSQEQGELVHKNGNWGICLDNWGRLESPQSLLQMS